ncbi:hypothetical protein [Alteromonas lipotrueiana]|uniref:hypothetical protein n=1 Tax=Alteromonas lipotrueiana TaxID=2803815 RepID=UPI001C482730|nr:hypothetical protein [Alteromonas lipotrueiana]
MPRGAKKGENRFGDHQTEKVDLRLELIKRVLENVKAWKMSFPNLWQLSQYVSNEVNLILKEEYPEIFAKPKGKITAPTISTKNETYKRELEKHLQSQNLENQYSEHVARIFELELKIDELNDENQRLNKFIKSSNIAGSVKSLPNKPLTETDDVAQSLALDACHKIILALIEASDGVFVFNDNQIEDPSQTADSIVVGKEQLEKSGLLSSYLYKGSGDE